MPPERASEMLSVTSAATVAGVCVGTIRNRIKDGSLPAYRLGPKLLRIARSDVERLFQPVGATDALAAHVASTVATAPPLNDDQCSRLAGLLGGRPMPAAA